MTELWNLSLAFLNNHGAWLATASLSFFILSIASVPLIVARIPVDYFTIAGHQYQRSPQHHPILHVFTLCMKNLLGLILLIVGMIMLFTPGQGILSILFGLMIMNYPGKFRLECAIMRKPLIFKAVNRMREKQHQAPLLAPEG